MSRGDGTEKKANGKGKQLGARRKWRRRKTGGGEAGLGLGGQLHHPRPHGLKAHLPRSGALGLIALHLEKIRINAVKCELVALFSEKEYNQNLSGSGVSWRHCP